MMGNDGLIEVAVLQVLLIYLPHPAEVILHAPRVTFRALDSLK